MTTRRRRFLSLLFRLLAGLAAVVLLFVIVTFVYLAFERFSGWNHLRIERAKLKADGLLRPISELAPPPSPEAVENGKKLLSVLKSL